MSFMKTGLLASILFLLLGITAAHAESGFDKGLFWQIKPAKGPASLLVGSIHMGDARVESKIQAAVKLLSGMQRLVLEMDAQELKKAGQMMLSGKDQPFAKHLSVEMTARTRAALVARGVDDAVIDKTPLWSAILMLSLPPGSEPGMDMRLLQEARGLKRPIYGLESAAEQLDSFRGLPQEVQVAILSWQVGNQDKLNYELGRVLDVYAAENIARLVDLEFEATAPETLSVEQQAMVLDRLINRRNTRMVERLEPHLKAGRALIAVGAMHLPGLLRELDALGYSIERVQP